MSICTPTPIRRAIADDGLLVAARTRRQLTDTALSATGGGDLHDLHADAVEDELWHARVRCQDGRQVIVRLDRRLGTVLIQDSALGARAV